MICKLDELQSSCKVILSAISANKINTTEDLLEIVSENNSLYLNISNSESYISVKVNSNAAEDFHATVNASKFLSLISKFTLDEVSLKINKDNLSISANGNYKLPLVYINNSILSLKKIELNNIINKFQLDGNLLNTILKYNSKQLGIGSVMSDAQKLYYLDSEGAITFTSGACINKFIVPITASYLLNDRLVKLFKLFSGKLVDIAVAYDALSEEITQTKLKFTTDTIDITYILPCDTSLIKSVPAKTIRSLSEYTYENSTVFSRVEMLNAINRLSVFSDEADICINAKFVYNVQEKNITLTYKSNEEQISLKESAVSTDNYEAIISLKDLTQVLSAFTEDYITLMFGNKKCFLLNSKQISYIVPETIV